MSCPFHHVGNKKERTAIKKKEALDKLNNMMIYKKKKAHFPPYSLQATPFIGRFIFPKWQQKKIF